MTRLFLIISLTFALNEKITATAAETISTNTKQSDSLLINIESKIHKAFSQGFKEKSNNALSDLDKSLEELNRLNNQKLITYWRGYLHYYSAIYYLKINDKKASEKMIDKGVDLTENIKNKNSEDYALLALLQGFAIQFKGMKAMFLSETIKENAQKAIAMDRNNLRGYYTYASNDFYTPEKFGGGKEAEEYLIKAISVKLDKTKKNYMPTWGKEEAYAMLIKLYIRQSRTEYAKKYYKEAEKKYPNSYYIKSLADKLKSTH